MCMHHMNAPSAKRSALLRRLHWRRSCSLICGTPASDVCRQLGISEAKFYLWNKKYPYLGVSELRRLRQVVDENQRLEQLVAASSPPGFARPSRSAWSGRVG